MCRWRQEQVTSSYRRGTRRFACGFRPRKSHGHHRATPASTLEPSWTMPPTMNASGDVVFPSSSSRWWSSTEQLTVRGRGNLTDGGKRRVTVYMVASARSPRSSREQPPRSAWIICWGQLRRSRRGKTEPDSRVVFNGTDYNLLVGDRADRRDPPGRPPTTTRAASEEADTAGPACHRRQKRWDEGCAGVTNWAGWEASKWAAREWSQPKRRYVLIFFFLFSISIYFDIFKFKFDSVLTFTLQNKKYNPNPTCDAVLFYLSICLLSYIGTYFWICYST
jgi:hypothetical protein